MPVRAPSPSLSFRGSLLALGLGIFGLSTPAQATALPCSLATQLDVETYKELSFQTPSELGLEPRLDELSPTYARCQASVLTTSLARNPNLNTRIATLRQLYQTLREQEGRLAYAHAGGGTLYWHAIPRSYPDIEITLRGLAALASSPVGRQRGAGYAQMIGEAKQNFETRLAAMRAWQTGKPQASEIGTEFDRSKYAKAVTDYQQTGQRLMNLLGCRNDATAAAGYLPLQNPLSPEEWVTP
jgi:hypothetical protein